MNQAEISIQRFSIAVAWGLSILITVMVPAIYFFISYQHLRSELVVQSVLSANDVTNLVRSNPTLWRYEDLRISEMLEQRSRRTVAESIVIYNTNREVIASNTAVVPPVHIGQKQDIYDAGVVVASIEIYRTLDPLLFSTLLVTLCSAAIAAVIFFTLRTLPRRSIKKAYQALCEKRKKYRSLHESMKEGMAEHRVTFANNGELESFTIIETNSSCTDMFGCHRQDLVGSDSLTQFGASFREYLSELLRVFEHGNSITFELALPERGAYYTTTAYSQSPGIITTLFEDITERKKSEQQIKKMAYSDQLTTLPNRALLLDRLNQAVANATQNCSTLAVFLLDLDRFKIFNDTMGRATGDQLLIEVGRRLQRQIRCSDTLARMGGDEFCFVAINTGKELNATYVAQKFMDSMLPPFWIGSNELHVTSSIGIAVFPDDGSDAETLIKSAELAMYSAKEAGRNRYNFYSPEMNLKAHTRMKLENGMRNALEHGEFFLEFQPIMDAGTRTITAAEALVRWNHPSRGRIPPNEFIPLAEETGLILPLGEWILRTVCRSMKTWNDAGLPQIRLSVNVSSRQIEQQNFAEIVRKALHATGANAAQLEIELTESCLVNHASTNLAEVFDLRSLGISIAIDDFGTGYSSLGYIKTLPIDHIKIDRSFVTDISSNIQDQAIVEAIITMSQKLGIQNIAEGVETLEQLEFLQSLRCDEIQGYYFHRPLSAEALVTLLRAQV
ncbi:MAG: EAL domain-containing protein [Desulfuromonadaceae bacterium]|nr:EAL domain-containing protein [Desulfuromonadaceae bacterium]MDD2847184.1 EAL domain-containing protein [Desulfuromonadaceae bacterium]MDD4130128.1 EAL domain-containing protein [Desulfuromonadaceae bacterium]